MNSIIIIKFARKKNEIRESVCFSDLFKLPHLFLYCLYIYPSVCDNRLLAEIDHLQTAITTRAEKLTESVTIPIAKGVARIYLLQFSLSLSESIYNVLVSSVQIVIE